LTARTVTNLSIAFQASPQSGKMPLYQIGITADFAPVVRLQLGFFKEMGS
jgi:hypothetical protein